MNHTTCLASNFEPCIPRPRALVASPQLRRRAFFGLAALLFLVAAAITVLWCNSMGAMGTMPMPGGWTMSMAWIRMPGQTWAGFGASFIGMWVVMMVAMMLPSLAPALWRFRQVVGGADAMRLHRLTLLVALGYFAVWTAVGMAVFPLGEAVALIEMQVPSLARAVPFAAGAIVLIGGAVQFTAWKAHHLACCRQAPSLDKHISADGGTAWRLGLRLGLHCTYGCAGLTAVLLVMGVMDLRAMAAVTVAITAERLAPRGERIAPAIGTLVIAAGVFMIARAIAFC